MDNTWTALDISVPSISILAVHRSGVAEVGIVVVLLLTENQFAVLSKGGNEIFVPGAMDLKLLILFFLATSR